jgi:hypothetical protein
VTDPPPNPMDAAASGTAPPSTDGGPTVIFLHIGKTGGMTLRTILNRQFPSSRIMVVRTRDRRPSNSRLRREETIEQFASLPVQARAEPRLIEGHVIFGVHEFVPRSSTYITLLRDPVALAISQYNFVTRRPGHWLHEELVSSGMSLDAYVESGMSLETDNSQTRAISGDTSAEFGECSEQMLEAAKSNIERHFAVAGITERFDETLILLGQAFGWSRLWYVPANVAPQAARRDPVSPETRERIADRNRFDVELYRWAGARFDAAVRAHPVFVRELRDLRRANALYRPWGHLTQTVPRRWHARWKGFTQTGPPS